MMVTVEGRGRLRLPEMSQRGYPRCSRITAGHEASQEPCGGPIRQRVALVRKFRQRHQAPSWLRQITRW